jgi:Flp pilus assembly protein TadD
LFIIFSGTPAIAHVEKDTMPDSVAEMEYRILLEFSPQDTATRSLLGMALLRQNKFVEAEKEFRLILRIEPKNFDGLDGLGIVLYKQKLFNDALPYLLTATKIRPNDIMVHLHLGLTLASAGQSEGAREVLRTGLSLLGKQTPSAARDQQMAEFKTAMAALPKKTSANSASARRD